MSLSPKIFDKSAISKNQNI